MDEFLNAAADGLIRAMDTYHKETGDSFANNNLYEVIEKLRENEKTSFLIFNINTALEEGDNFQVFRIAERTIKRLKDIHEIEFIHLEKPKGGNVHPIYILINEFKGATIKG